MLGKIKTDGGLGYRDFELFNLALLGKQEWRLLHQPFSLAARVMKAKYYFKSDFSLVRFGSNASYLWRSFLKARPMLEEGMMWRIGNGEAVNIWKDKWILQPTSFRIWTPLIERYAHWQVSKLIDENTKA